jgi:hypothetical protein
MKRSYSAMRYFCWTISSLVLTSAISSLWPRIAMQHLILVPGQNFLHGPVEDDEWVTYRCTYQYFHFSNETWM